MLERIKYLWREKSGRALSSALDVGRKKARSESRRKFLALAGTAGALFLSKSFRAWAEEHPERATHQRWERLFDPEETAPRFYPRKLPSPGEKVHQFAIEIVIGRHEILPKVSIHGLLFNGKLPGPELRVREGDWVEVKLTNKTKEGHTIHWHGLQVPCEMDGVPLGTQWPVLPGQTFTYLFRAQPAGTHFYHCHVMTHLHVQAGLFGALVVEPKEDLVAKVFPYSRDYTLVLSEINTSFVRDEMNRMESEMGKMQKMAKSPRLMREMSGFQTGFFRDKRAFLQAVSRGYVPPYLRARHGVGERPYDFDYFLINGRAYPMTEELRIKTGESIRVRFINAGMWAHFIHLHGHDFWHVCQDGHPLPQPLRLNTIPVFPGSTSDIVIQGTNPGHWHFHDHSDRATTNNGHFPGGMMTALAYEDAVARGFRFHPLIAVDS